MDNLQSKIVAIQSSLKAPKGQKNTFGNYKYRSCEDICEAVKPFLKEHSLTLTLSDELVFFAGTAPQQFTQTTAKGDQKVIVGGDRFYVKATALISDGTSQITVVAFAREEQDKKGMDSSQITGAASSYARKYALNGLFLIDDTKDADTMDNTKQEPKVVKPVEKTKPTVPQVIDALRPCKKVEHVEAVMASTKKYAWTPEETQKITDAKNHVLDCILLA